ncbi:signal peptidase I [Brevibacterium litoralis]|uniref:signal peptidase I n=1 Tax=Brevibacterium litoralis TaxID=3138935 RepID=UPI0032EADD27
MAPRGPRLRRVRGLLRPLGVVLVAALVLAAVVRGLGIQNYRIPSESMLPTLEVDDVVTIWRPDALSGSIDRGDVVVIDGRGSFVATLPPDDMAVLLSWFGFGPKDVFYVKRVIALGGDRLTCCDESGRLLLNGEPLDEPYLPAGVPASEAPFDIEIPADRLWLMGDNRTASADSRSLLGKPGGGMIPTARVLGTVIGHGSSVDA